MPEQSESEVDERVRSERKRENIRILQMLGKWQTAEEIQAAGGKKSAVMESAEELIVPLGPRPLSNLII